MESAEYAAVRELYEQAIRSLAEQRCSLAEAQKRLRTTEARIQALRHILAETAPEPDFKEQLLDAAESLIRDNGDLTLSALHAALLRTGTPLPGSGTLANLSGYLTRSGGRIVRKHRGIYGLPEPSEPSDA